MFKSLLEAFAAPERAGRSDLDTPLAAAALFVHVARSDGDYAEAERAAIDRALADAFALAPAAAEALRARAEASQAAAADVQRFTKVLKEAYGEAEREAFLERIWRVALADGVRDPHEDAFMRQLAALLYVPDPRSAAARRRAMED